MTKMSAPARVDPATVFRDWLARFGDAVAAPGGAIAVGRLFIDTASWKDVLSLTWEHRAFAGSDRIGTAIAEGVTQFGISNIRQSEGRAPPRLLRRMGRWVVEGFFDFDTKFGRASSFVRLVMDKGQPDTARVWLLYTALQNLHDHPEKIGSNRPTGNEYAMNTRPTNWSDDRVIAREFADRDPEVLIIGGGHAGLILAARLGQMDVDALVIEKTARIGDVWRDRYHSLTLHNETTANHMPYLPFPETWPTWLSKDRLAGWLEYYAEALELNVWTSTELLSSEYDPETRLWTAHIRRDGQEQTITCKHLVASTGVSGSIPNRPEIPGLDEFKGEVRHSGEYSRGAEYKGKNCLVVGTGNSAHDVAQDLYVNGATSVALYQRSPTCVVSLDPSAISVFKIYSEGAPEDMDLVTAALPYDVLFDTYQFMTRRHAEQDRPMIEALNKAGFETYYGHDDTGFHMMYMRGEGGYYINVGCSDLIIDGKVGVVQHRDAERFVSEGLLMKDGTIRPLDLVVLATGFRNMQEGIRELMGDEVADKVGSIWGFDQDWQMKGMWRRTPQDGFWVMGGALIDARLNSRYLAIEIKADLLGLLPDRAEMPLIARD